MYLQTDQTIVAIGSPPGQGAVGIVRLSGPEALRIAAAMFAPESGDGLEGIEEHRRVYGEVLIDDGLGVPGQVYVFRGPRSFTTQDTVELHAPGNPVLLGMLVERAVALGARPAQPGEFTARAMLLGRISRTQAEAVAAVIHAETDSQLAAAEELLDGWLGERARAIQGDLADLLSLVTADIDFSEEPVEFIAPEALRDRLDDLIGQLDSLLACSVATERLETAPRVLLAGAPNVGKSSLMNRLSGVDRAICSPLSGTTRDVLTAPLELPDAEAILIDAAGLAGPVGLLEAQAAERTRRMVARAEVVCWIVDLSAPDTWSGAPEVDGGRVQPGADEHGATQSGPRGPGAPRPTKRPDRLLLVANKIDLLDPAARAAAIESLTAQWGHRPLGVSALTGAGCDALREAIARHLTGEAVGAVGPGRRIVALSAAHRASLRSAKTSLAAAREMLADVGTTLDCAELLAVDLRDAADHLGELAGDVVTEDLLERIFSRFCIGK